MNKFFRNLSVVAVSLLVSLFVLTLLASYIWHKGAFRWVYQFATSAGLLACAFYFFLLSGGSGSTRIKWGLLFLVLSPVSYLLSNMIFWHGALPEFHIAPPGNLSFAGEADLLGFVMEAQIGPAVPVILLAALGFLVGNAVLIAKQIEKHRFIGANLLLLAWTVMMYWTACR